MSSCRRFLTCLAAGGLFLLLVGQAACGRDGRALEETRIDIARRAFLNGEYLRAEGVYERYLETQPDGPYRLEAWVRLADISQYARETPARTATVLEAALLEFGENPATGPALRLRAARQRQQLGEYDKAAAHYKQLLAIPGLPPERVADIHIEFAEALMQAHDPMRAVGTLRTCGADLPAGDPHARCSLALAKVYLRLERPVQAEPLLRALYLHQDVPEDIRAQAGFALATWLEAGQDKEQARTIYESLRRTYPNPLVIEEKLRYLQKTDGNTGASP